MKSVKDIAEICKVSKTTVQRTVRELDIKPLNYKNMFVFEDADVQKIIDFITPNETIFKETATDATATQTKETNETENETNCANTPQTDTAQVVDLMRQQLEEKDKQIADLLDKLSVQMEITKLQSQNIAYLSKAIEDKKDAESEKMDNTETNETKGFFSRLFGL